MHNLEYSRFRQIGLAARRHFGGTLDQALTRAAENEIAFLTRPHPVAESAEHLEFYRELQAMIPVAAECVHLYHNGMHGAAAPEIFRQALANLNGAEVA